MTPPSVADAFDDQAKACANLDSPFMAQLCRLFAQKDWPDTSVRDRIFAWDGDLTPKGESVPLRLAGALHALRLQGLALDAVYPPATVPDETLWAAVCAAMSDHDTFINDWINSAPQTNEVRRSAAIIPVGQMLAARFDLPIRTSELGASGGLNLKWDQYALRIGDRVYGKPDVLTLEPKWTGPLPQTAAPKVIARSGVDLNPLDPRAPKDALRLQAYLWPDQPERMARTKAAIQIADGGVVQADAIDWLTQHIAPKSGLLHLIYHTVAWQYFPSGVQEAGTALIEKIGATVDETCPLAWFGMENDGQMAGAALTLRLWPGDLRIDLGRADFHGRWINWKGVTL